MRHPEIHPPILPILAILLVAAAPALAGVHYEAINRMEPLEGGGKPQTTSVEAWVDGESARIDIHESAGNQALPQGTWMVTTDGGQTLYLVNPDEKSYLRIDLAQALSTLGAVEEMTGGMVDLEFTDPDFEKSVDEPGPELLGYDTRHYRYRLGWGLRMKVLGMTRESHFLLEQDVWATDAIGDAAFGVWMRKLPRETGNDSIDRLIAVQSGALEGLPLKSEGIQTMTNKKGKVTSKARVSQEVTSLEQGVAVDPSRFEIPAGYEETTVEMPQSEEGEKRPFGKLFGRKKGDG